MTSKKLNSKAFEVCLQGTHSVLIPEKVALTFTDAGHRRVIAVASFQERSIRFHAALQKRNGNHYIMFSKDKQKTINILPSDYFYLQFFEDTTKYGVEMPEELEEVLNSDPDSQKIFDSFTSGKKRSIIYMVLRFKNSQSRIDKALLICENLKRGILENKNLLKRY